MPYVTEEYYNTFTGEPVDDFPALARRAEEIIEEITLYRVTEVTFNSFDEFTKGRIKNAVCAQIEYLNANGGSDIDMGNDYQSVALGKFNYTKSSNGNSGTGQSIYSPRAMRILALTGLMYRGGRV